MSVALQKLGFALFGPASKGKLLRGYPHLSVGGVMIGPPAGIRERGYIYPPILRKYVINN